MMLARLLAHGAALSHFNKTSRSKVIRGTAVLLGGAAASSCGQAFCKPRPATRNSRKRQDAVQEDVECEDLPFEPEPEPPSKQCTQTSALMDMLRRKATTSLSDDRADDSDEVLSLVDESPVESRIDEVNQEARHSTLGLGIVRKKRHSDGKLLFEWHRWEIVGRGKKRQKQRYNRWVSTHEVEAVKSSSTSTSSETETPKSDEEYDTACGTTSAKLASHHRERQVHEHSAATKSTSWGVGGVRCSKTVRTIAASNMIKDHFGDEHFVPDLSKKDAVFCRACKKSYPLIKSSLTSHVNSEKHKKAKENFSRRMGDDSSLKLYLEEYFQAHPLQDGASVDTELQIYRYRVVESMLGNGIAMARVTGLRPLLERGGMSLTDSAHLGSMIPRIHEREIDLVTQEIVGQYVTLIFDGTTRLGEAVNVVYRFCPADFSGITQRLVDFTTMEKHMNGNELGRHLVNVITVKTKTPYSNLVGSARDSCATNGAGLRVIQPFFPAMVNVLCYSHMLQCTGSRFEFVSLDQFVTPFLHLQSMAVVKSLWREIMGTALPGYSKIRWWSRWELMKSIAAGFGPNLNRFIAALEERDIGEETIGKMKAVLNNSDKRDALELELAIVMDMEQFVTATYKLEGDGLTVLQAYDTVEELRRFGRSLHVQSSMPNTAALLRSRAKLEAGLKFRQYWSETDAPGQSGWYNGQVIGKKPGHGQLCAVRYDNGDEMWIVKNEEQTFRGNILAHELSAWQDAVNKVKPAFNYIEDRLNDNCDTPYHMRVQHSQMSLYKVRTRSEHTIGHSITLTHCLCALCALQIFNPSEVNENPPDDSFVDAFSDVPAFVEHKLIEGMKQELKEYITAAKNYEAATDADLSSAKEFDKSVLQFWAKNNTKFKTWAIAARIVFSLSANSAACERVFSMLKLFYGEQRDAALADQIESSLMLAYNGRALG